MTLLISRIRLKSIPLLHLLCQGLLGNWKLWIRNHSFRGQIGVVTYLIGLSCWPSQQPEEPSIVTGKCSCSRNICLFLFPCFFFKGVIENKFMNLDLWILFGASHIIGVLWPLGLRNKPEFVVSNLAISLSLTTKFRLHTFTESQSRGCNMGHYKSCTRLAMVKRLAQLSWCRQLLCSTLHQACAGSLGLTGNKQGRLTPQGAPSLVKRWGHKFSKCRSKSRDRAQGEMQRKISQERYLA